MEEENLYEEFETLYDENKYKEALVLIDKLILMNQSKADYFNEKGVCLSNIGGRGREELECYNTAVSLDDKNTRYITNKGAALVQLGEYDEGHRVLDLSLKLDEKYPKTYYWKGVAFYYQLQYFKSLEYMDKCLIIDPELSNAHYYKGLTLREMNCFEDSIKEFDLEIKLNPKDDHNFYDKALTLMKMEEYDKAITELNKSINIDPDNFEFLNNKATCLIKLNKLKEAWIVTEQSLNKTQSNSEALKNKAQIYLKKNKPKTALKLTKKGFKETPEFYELKGLILHKLTKEDEAIDCFLKAIQLKDKTHKTIIENMSSIIIDKHKDRILKSELQNLKELNDNCVKLLTEIKKNDPIIVNQQSFSPVNLPVYWKKIPFDKSNIINYLNVHDSFICQICLSLVKSPKSCLSCDNVFCSECLNEALAIKDSCPNCRANPFKEFRMNLIVKNIYDSIETQCPLECGENFLMKNFEKHLSLCEKREKHFECNLCKESLKSEEEVENHKQKCPEIMLQCSMCNENFKNPCSGNHIQSCFERLVECEKCLCVIPFKYEGSHRDYFCDLLKCLVEGAQKIQKKLIELQIF